MIIATISSAEVTPPSAMDETSSVSGYANSSGVDISKLQCQTSNFSKHAGHKLRCLM